MLCVEVKTGLKVHKENQVDSFETKQGHFVFQIQGSRPR